MPPRRRAINDLSFQIADLDARPVPASRRHRVPASRGFTLLELLVVIGIIVLLAAILVPVVSQVRMKGYVAVTQAQLQRIATAVQSYYHDFKAYPGPLPNSQLAGWPNSASVNITVDPNAQPQPPQFDPKNITSSENLVLGLFGVLAPPSANNQNNSTGVTYSGFPPKHDVLSLNPVRPASYHYIDYIPEELSIPTGYAYASRFGGQAGSGQSLNVDGAAAAHPGDTSGAYAQPVGLDSTIPEFMDKIPDYMPILYIRANVGVAVSSTYTGIATVATPPQNPPAQYDATQLKYYGFNNVYVTDYPLPTGTNVSGPDAQWIGYFMNPNIVGQPRGKDGFILISAGADRLYGTKDDIIVTP